MHIVSPYVAFGTSNWGSVEAKASYMFHCMRKHITIFCVCLWTVRLSKLYVIWLSISQFLFSEGVDKYCQKQNKKAHQEMKRSKEHAKRWKRENKKRLKWAQKKSFRLFSLFQRGGQGYSLFCLLGCMLHRASTTNTLIENLVHWHCTLNQLVLLSYAYGIVIITCFLPTFRTHCTF